MATVRRQKLQRFGHITWRAGALAYDIMHGTVMIKLFRLLLLIYFSSDSHKGYQYKGTQFS